MKLPSHGHWRTEGLFDMEFLESIAAGAGLSGFGTLGTLLVGVLILLVIVKVLSMPFKLVWNGLLGALLLWLVNFAGGFVGFGLKITVLKALIAGIFGIPGALAVVLFEIFG